MSDDDHSSTGQYRDNTHLSQEDFPSKHSSRKDEGSYRDTESTGYTDSYTDVSGNTIPIGTSRYDSSSILSGERDGSAHENEKDSNSGIEASWEADRSTNANKSLNESGQFDNSFSESTSDRTSSRRDFADSTALPTSSTYGNKESNSRSNLEPSDYDREATDLTSTSGARFGTENLPSYSTNEMSSDAHASETRMGIGHTTQPYLGSTEYGSGTTAGVGHGNKTAPDPENVDTESTRFDTAHKTESYSGGTSYGSGSTAGPGAGNKTSSDIGSNDSTMGKLMEKAGSMLKKDSMVEKGTGKRETAGYTPDA